MLGGGGVRAATPSCSWSLRPHPASAGPEPPEAPGLWSSSVLSAGRAQQRGTCPGLTYRWTRALEAAAWPALFGTARPGAQPVLVWSLPGAPATPR